MRNLTILIMTTLCATGGFAESKVFIDAMFPYRVVCATSWVEMVKSDTLFSLRDATPNKKTQLQLRRYQITDTNYSHETMNWSRLNYVVNRELADGVGETIGSDTSTGRKVSGIRAFELFAFYSQETSGKKVWWAELCRWTERNRFGYLVTVIGDTLDLMKNMPAYKTMLDSVDIKDIVSTPVTVPATFIPAASHSAISYRADCDLLGRIEGTAGTPRTMLIIRRGKTTLQLRELHAR